MLHSLDQVALYLNLATARIKDDKGSLKFITGNDATTIRDRGGDTQETQCLSFGNAIWIANNDDEDSWMQCEYLNKMGVNLLNELVDHVDQYQSRVITVGPKSNFLPKNPMERLLLAIASRDDDVSLNKFSLAGTLAPPNKQANNPMFKLSGSDKAPLSGIVFVIGKYEGVGNTEHAEQKLLAALSKSLGAVTGNVTISGCKMACSVCQKVLNDAKKMLHDCYIKLSYDDPTINDLRVKSKLKQTTTDRTKAMDVNGYFG